jgi:hypothetical protein
MIMTKFQKRLLKFLETPENSIILGQGFGEIEDLAHIFQSIFLISELPPEKKFKNLIYRENYENLSQLFNISVVFVAVRDVKKIDNIVSILNRWRPIVIVEGNDLIGRDLSKTLYDNGYLADSQHGNFHVWKIKK